MQNAGDKNVNESMSSNRSENNSITDNMTQKQKILIVDDSQVQLLIYNAMLGGLDADIDTATTGEEAVTKALTHDFDLILMDVSMPGIDGLEAVESIKREEKNKFIPVIFQTGKETDTQLILKGLEVGAVDFIEKSISREILLIKVNNLLELQRNRKELESTKNELFQKVEELEALLLERKKTEKTLKVEKEKLQNVISGTNAGTWEWNVQTGETIFNKRWAEIVGYKLDELEPISIKTWEKLANPGDLLKSGELLQAHFNKESELYSFDSRMRHKNGSWVWVSDTGRVFEWDKENKPLKMFGTHIDISSRKQAEFALEKAKHNLLKLSLTDPLTQVANRRRFDEYINIELNRAYRDKIPLSVVMCDIDFFKIYNDTYGHISGDSCLKEVANVIKSALKRPSDFLARFGGEEFALVMPNTDIAGALNIAENIRTSMMNKRIKNENSSVSQYVTLSLGVSTVFPGRNVTPDEIINEADKALYQAKNKGRNRVERFK